jgi:hypothetical protein
MARASTGVAHLLRGPMRPARVLHCEPSAVHLSVRQADGSHEVVAVLTSDTGPTAVGCRLARPADHRLLVPVPPGSAAWVGRGGLTVGQLVVRAASWWDPRPRLPRSCPQLLPEAVQHLRGAVFGSGATMRRIHLPGLPDVPYGPLAALRGALHRSDFDAALRAAVRLLGLGRGPAPAGDAVLAGTTAGLVLLGHPEAGRLVDRVVGRAGSMTTELSAALLRHAAAGRVGGELGAVVQGTVGIGPVAPALDALVADGSTNGRAQALGLYTAIRLIQRTAPRA